MTGRGAAGGWVLLSYRMPREPSSPRIAVWRRLEQLGVARLGDGLVALPGDARTREQLDWLAEHIVENGGVAGLWLSTPGTQEQERQIARDMSTARAAEYQAVIDEAARVGGAAQVERMRAVRRLREQLRRIDRRDFFPPPQRDAAHLAVRALAEDADASSSAGSLA